jgi:branched-chain amino acid transport system permease protein
MYLILKSPFGATLQAIRDNTQRCEAVGIHVRRHQLIAIVIATFLLESRAFFLSYWNAPFSRPTVLGFVTRDVHHDPFGRVVYFCWSIMGTAIIVALRTFVGKYTEYWTLILGILLILLIFFLPEGSWAIFKKYLSLEPEGGEEKQRIDVASRSIVKSFDDFMAVNGQAAVEKGEIVAVIGPNSAGKTTV